MGKVVTSQGLQEFVESGKVTHVPDHKPETKPASAETTPPVSETKPATAETKSSEGETKPEPKGEAETDEELTAEERKILGERIDKIVGKKHRAMKEAQEAAAESDRFAESQYNERKLAEQRAMALEAELNEIKTKQAPAKPPEEVKPPNIADFKDPSTGNIDWDKFTDAKAEFAANKAVAAERERLAKEQAAEEQAAVQRRVKDSAERARKAHSDFDDVMSSVKGTVADRVPQYVLNYLSESENAGEIAYHLAKHPEESERIAKLSPIRGLAELGKLEDRLAKPPEKKPEPPVTERGGAPAPITPLSGEGTAGVNTDPSKMSYKELRAYERARMKSRN